MLIGEIVGDNMMTTETLEVPNNQFKDYINS